MRKLTFVSLILLAAYGPVSAQQVASTPPPAQATVKVEFNENEEKVLLQACQAAEWASRVQYQGLCDFLKERFAKARSAK